MLSAVNLATFLDSPLSARAGILADLDGCLIAGDRVLPDVPELLAQCGARLWIVSNNSTETAPGLVRRLAGLGLELPPERIVLAGEETLRQVAADCPGARVAVFATPPIQALARDLGLQLDRSAPDLVVLARDTGFGFADLAALVALAHRGVPLRLTNPDATHPGEDGVPVPETGALWAALSAAVPGLHPTCLGKPAPDLLRRALARAGVLPGAAVFIGDTPETDGAAAAAAGVDFVLLRRPGAAPALPREAIR